MSVENSFERNVESSGEKRMMSWQELISDQALNEDEMSALRIQAQLRLDDLQNTFPEGSDALTLDETTFEVDLKNKRVLRAVWNEESV
mgnify:CR=1 FL=1